MGRKARFVSGDPAQWTSYCETGGVNEAGEKIVHQHFEGQAGYDHFHVAEYLKEVIAFRVLEDEEAPDLAAMPRQEKMFFLYEIFRHFNFDLSYLELGSSLMEVIDGVHLLCCAGERELLRRVCFMGVEPSRLMQQAAVHLHHGYNITHHDRVADAGRVDVLYDRAVSSYRYTTAGELAQAMNRATLCFVNLYLTEGESYSLVNEMGKVVTYFSLAELQDMLEKPLYHLFGRRREDKVEAFFLNCSAPMAQAVFQRFEENALLARFMRRKGVHLLPVADMAGQGA